MDGLFRGWFLPIQSSGLCVTPGKMPGNFSLLGLKSSIPEARILVDFAYLLSCSSSVLAPSSQIHLE